jgi:hypothetical protein
VPASTIGPNGRIFFSQHFIVIIIMANGIGKLPGFAPRDAQPRAMPIQAPIMTTDTV